MMDEKPIEIVNQSETSIVIKIPEISKLEEVREFRIKATTNGGAVAYTENIKIIKYRCPSSENALIPPAILPNTGTRDMYEIGLIKSEYKLGNFQI